jgi:hypothetical protein
MTRRNKDDAVRPQQVYLSPHGGVGGFGGCSKFAEGVGILRPAEKPAKDP